MHKIRLAVFTILFMQLLIVCFAEASYFTQVNLDGFGTPDNTGGLEMKTMIVFKEKLYIGVANEVEGAQVWSYDDRNYKQVNSSGFGSAENSAVFVMTADGNNLYAGTTNVNGGEIWAFDGHEWRCLHIGRFGDILSQSITAMAVFKGKLYVGLWDQISSRPTEIWMYDGEASWEMVNFPGFGSRHNLCTVALGVAPVDNEERLFAMVWKSFQYTGKDAGCEIWTYDGNEWIKINTGLEGFGKKGKGRVGMEPFSFAVYKGKIYVGLWAFEGGIGWEVWAWDGKEWSQVNKNIMKETFGFRLCIALTVYKGLLYAAVTDAFTDFELWSYDEKRWQRVVGKDCATPSKFDDIGNKLINSMAVYKDKLYLGLVNDKTGYEIWRNDFPEIYPQKKQMLIGEKELFYAERGKAPIKWALNNEKVGVIDTAAGYFEAIASGEISVYATDAFGFGFSPLEIEVSKGVVKDKKRILAFSKVMPSLVLNDRCSNVFLTTKVYIDETDITSINVAAHFSPALDGELTLCDDGTHGDKVKGDKVFSFVLDVPKDTKPGKYAVKFISTLNKGIKDVSEASFTVKQGYSVPTIASIELKGNCANIPILFDLTDLDQDKCRVTVEYLRKGEKWMPASIYSKSGWIKKYRNKEKISNKIAKLPTPELVNHYVCVWNSEKDVGKTKGKYFIRLTPEDKKTVGQAVVSDLLKINNKKKPEQEMIYVKKGNFYIDKYEYPNQYGSYPETRMTLQEAKDVCLEQGKELCTPNQWETAYLGDSEKNYPYGDDYGFEGRSFCNTNGSSDKVSVPSGIYENCVNDLGIYDMGGNIYEWCENEEGEVFMADRSYIMNPLDSSRINVEDPTHRHTYLGHRCCKSGK